MVKFIDRPDKQKPAKHSRALQTVRAAKTALDAPVSRRREEGRIPNASLVYALAAAVFLVLSFYFLFVLSQWLTGLLLFILAGTLMGYASYFMRFR